MELSGIRGLRLDSSEQAEPCGGKCRLSHKQDFLVTTRADPNPESEPQLPGMSDPQHIAVAFYPVDVYQSEVLQKLSADERCLWLSSAELCAGRAPGGERMNPCTLTLLNRFEIVQAWQ